MTAATARLSERQAWSALTAHHTQIRERHLRKLFADDRTRGERMTLDAVGLYLDYSKNPHHRRQPTARDLKRWRFGEKLSAPLRLCRRFSAAILHNQWLRRFHYATTHFTPARRE